jgi:hypothetical protein
MLALPSIRKCQDFLPPSGAWLDVDVFSGLRSGEFGDYVAMQFPSAIDAGDESAGGRGLSCESDKLVSVGGLYPDDFRTHPAFRGLSSARISADEEFDASDLIPLTIINCLRHLLIAVSKRSMTSSSFIKPSSVAGSPISTSS